MHGRKQMPVCSRTVHIQSVSNKLKKYNMSEKILPALGIIIVTIILVAINEFTEMTFIKDYALIFIIAGMLLGVGLTKLADKSKGEK